LRALNEEANTMTTDHTDPDGLTAEQLAKIRQATACGPPLTQEERDALSALFAEDVTTCEGYGPAPEREE
jgi:hypothetical protein